MRNHEFVFNAKYLLCFTLVGRVSLFINAPSIISCACSFMAPARYQSNRAFNLTNFSSYLTHIALHYWSEPLLVYFLSYKVSVYVIVPEVRAIACNSVQWVFCFIWYPIDSTLSTRCQVIAVGKVKAVLKQLINRFNRFVYCFWRYCFLERNHFYCHDFANARLFQHSDLFIMSNHCQVIVAFNNNYFEFLWVYWRSCKSW